MPSASTLALIVSGRVKLCLLISSPLATISLYCFWHFSGLATIYLRYWSFNSWNFFSAYLFSSAIHSLSNANRIQSTLKAFGLSKSIYLRPYAKWKPHPPIFASATLSWRSRSDSDAVNISIWLSLCIFSPKTSNIWTDSFISMTCFVSSSYFPASCRPFT